MVDPGAHEAKGAVGDACGQTERDAALWAIPSPASWSCTGDAGARGDATRDHVPTPTEGEQDAGRRRGWAARVYEPPGSGRRGDRDSDDDTCPRARRRRRDARDGFGRDARERGRGGRGADRRRRRLRALSRDPGVYEGGSWSCLGSGAVLTLRLCSRRVACGGWLGVSSSCGCDGADGVIACMLAW
jgi:hypothetical protein